MSHFILPLRKRNLRPAVLISCYLQWCLVSWTKVETSEGNLLCPAVFPMHLIMVSGESLDAW